MKEKIRLGDLLTGEVEEIDREVYDDCVKKGWLLNRSDWAERKYERDENSCINPDNQSDFVEWSKKHGRKT